MKSRQSPVVALLVVNLLLVSVVTTLSFVGQQEREQGQEQGQQQQQRPTHPNGNNNARGPNICPGAWPLFLEESVEDENEHASSIANDANNTTTTNTTRTRIASYLQQLYDEADAYHNLGGNLAALSAHLDRQIDYTYEQLLLQFVMDDKSKNNNNIKLSSSIRDQILAELRARDVQKRGGYYQRTLPGSFERVLPKRGTMQKFDNREWRFLPSVLESPTSERWDLAMGPQLRDRYCRGFAILPGGRRYEDKYICGWDSLSKTTTVTAPAPTPPCNIISIGSNDQWGLETTILKNTTHCRVATFDCTIQQPKRMPQGYQDRLQFHSVCISNETKVTPEGRRYATYQELLELAQFDNDSDNDNGAATYLKMDVEGFEYNVLTSMIRQAKRDNKRHLLPQQLQIEFHYSTWMHADLPWSLRSREAGELMAFFALLFREGGYVAVHVEQTVHPSIREILFLKVFC